MKKENPSTKAIFRYHSFQEEWNTQILMNQEIPLRKIGNPKTLVYRNIPLFLEHFLMGRNIVAVEEQALMLTPRTTESERARSTAVVHE